MMKKSKQDLIQQEIDHFGMPMWWMEKMVREFQEEGQYEYAAEYQMHIDDYWNQCKGDYGE